MDEKLAGNDARLMTSLEIDLNSKNPALAAALAELKPVLQKVLRIVRELPTEGPGSFSKVAEGECPSNFTKVHFSETVNRK
jgi:hypothetical protein